MIKKLYLTATLLCACTNSMASAYIGVGVGTVDVGIAGFDDPTGFEINIGTEINNNLSLEASFINFGEASDGIVPQWRLTHDSFAFGGLAKAQVNRNFDVFFKAGIHMWNVELKEDGYGLLGEDDGTDIFYGVGALVNVNNKLGLGARYTSYDMDGDDVKMFSINAQIGF